MIVLRDVRGSLSIEVYFEVSTLKNRLLIILQSAVDYVPMLNVPGTWFLVYIYVRTWFCFQARRGHVIPRTAL